MKTIDINSDSFEAWEAKRLFLTGLPTIIVWVASATGLVLSIMSALNICNSACSEASQYTIFGVHFGWFGILYFGMLLAVLCLQLRFARAGYIADILIFLAAGAELRFIWLQKYVIGRWCPVCLSIAATIYLMTLVVLLNRRSPVPSRRNTMKQHMKRVTAMLIAVAVGLAGAFLGVKKEAEAAELNMFLGKMNSPTVVYIVSDWFCPACRRVEPAIEKMYPKIAAIAKVGFVDIPVHPETSNFTPYNLQFLAYQKGRYIELRWMLGELAKRTKTPSPEDVQKAIAPLGVKLRNMNYSDIAAGMNWNEKIFRTYGVHATPTVVVANDKSGKHANLVGENEISYQAILTAIASVAK